MTIPRIVRAALAASLIAFVAAVAGQAAPASRTQQVAGDATAGAVTTLPTTTTTTIPKCVTVTGPDISNPPPEVRLCPIP